MAKGGGEGIASAATLLENGFGAVAVLLVILCARSMAQRHFASVLAFAKVVMSSSAQGI